MNALRQLINLLFQILFAGLILFVVYFLFLLGDFKGRLDGIIGLIFNQFILGSIIISVTLVTCFIVGLPIRFVKKLNKRWVDDSMYTIIALSIALTLLTLSLVNYWRLPDFKDNPNGEYYKHVNTFYIIITITGWFATAFITLHIYPIPMIRKLADWLTKSKKGL